MKYHDIRTDDMLNGDGLRVVLFVSGCKWHCPGCHNPETHDPNSGLPFTQADIDEILDKLEPDYISGLTISGGDPFYKDNRWAILNLIEQVKESYPSKTIWIYTGYKWEDLIYGEDIPVIDILKLTDVLVDGRFKESLADESYPWAGSTNQRVIDVQRSLRTGLLIRHESRPRSHEPVDLLGLRNF